MAEFEAITTQEEFDARLKDRLERERKKEREAVKKEYDGFLSPEDAQKKYEGYLSPDEVKEKYKGYLTPEEGAEKDKKIKGYETNSVKMRIAHENGIPFELAEKLSGEDEESIKKDAMSIARFLKSANTPPLASTEPITVDSKKAAAKKMLAGLKGE